MRCQSKLRFLKNLCYFTVQYKSEKKSTIFNILTKLILHKYNNNTKNFPTKSKNKFCNKKTEDIFFVLNAFVN